MNAMMRSLRGESGKLRGLTGSGEPGLFTLLGGTGGEQDASGLAFSGGSGQVSSVARLAVTYHDTRLAALASGVSSSTRTGPRIPIGEIKNPERYL